MKKSNVFVVLFATLLIAIAVIGFSKVNSANARMIEGIDNYTISQTWKLPEELNEISGITWVNAHTIACVEDEHGVIYIYDLVKETVVEEIPFAGNGDYEGIALHDTNMYVMQSDGLLYEIKDWHSADRSISTHQTDFKASNNMESLTYSATTNSLLTVPKDRDRSMDYKGIYKISLPSKNVDINRPEVKIDMNADALKPYKHKKLQKTFNPSEIAVHPKTNEIYVLEGKKPKLMIMDISGQIKSVYKLDEINFPQPEGLTFSADGALYISSESSSGPATIHLVELKQGN